VFKFDTSKLINTLKEKNTRKDYDLATTVDSCFLCKKYRQSADRIADQTSN